MKKITLLTVFMLFSFTAFAQQGPFLYQVEANWLAECDTETPLTTEDFEGSPSGVAFCGPELSSTVSSNCFPDGELEDGFTITIENDANILYAPPGQLGSNQDVPTIGAEGNTGNFTIVTFTEAVTRVAFDIFGVSNTNGNGIIRVFDTNDTLLETFDITYIVSDFDFFGIHSSELIGRIELEDADNGDALFVSNLRFGTCRVNDDPATATMLTVGDVFEDNVIDGINNFASDSQLVDPTIPAPGCASYNGGDVWFSATVPASGSITVESQFSENSALGDSGIALYTEDLTEVLDCDDDDGEGLFSLISLTDRTPGEIVLIRVWEFGGNGFGEFMISAYDFSPPPNDLIENAIDVDELGFPYTDNNVNFPDATGDSITNSNGCSITTTRSVWYKFTTTDEGTITANFEDPTNNDNKTIIFYSAADENATLDDLTYVNSGTNTCGFNLEVSFEADANQTYYAFAQASTSIQTINIDSDALLSTEEATIEGFSFFPNPVEDILNINATQSIEQVVIYNITGQKVVEQEVNATNTQLSIGRLPTGIYLMTARSGAITSTYKVIKK
ncbi:T9SS type A sorting domain-containing protein [uncultured Dokdonia sp.]|uniref:T9SS type A sorting domain-containing protein n=1 Tax=uncultured Dokdonia sp. TaxID=575653 RepID=UPI0026195443|nr:T9SS type A sorting domain-containing protein [uncultured Dokdonia sp.]